MRAFPPKKAAATKTAIPIRRPGLIPELARRAMIESEVGRKSVD
jgi:hypothetical protein